jgi:hypothetical protein
MIWYINVRTHNSRELIMRDVCPALKVVVVQSLHCYYCSHCVDDLRRWSWTWDTRRAHYCYQVVCSYDIKCSYCHGVVR